MLGSLRRALGKFVGAKTTNTVPTVAVFVTDEAIFVISEKMTKVARETVEPMLRLERDSPPDVVGNAILSGLDAFVDSDEPPDRDGARKLLEFVGARTWTPFARTAINISVAGLSKDTVGLSPARANRRGDYLYRDTHNCPREATAIGELLEHLAGKLSP